MSAPAAGAEAFALAGVQAVPGAREGEITVRAILAGTLVGALLCVANLYTGLQTGLWDSGHITAAVLAFAFASAVRGRFSRLENNTALTIATAAGAMPATAGLLGAAPALTLLGHAPPPWALALWGLVLGGLGVAMALALRRRLIEEEKLPFPTGIATAELVEALHGDQAAARGRTRALLLAGLAAAAIGWFRQGRPAWIPSEMLLPMAVMGIPAGALTLGISTSPLIFGVGMVAGVRVGLSLLFGSVLAWAAIAPMLVHGPLRLAAGYGPLSEWLTWPGVGILVGAALVSLGRETKAFAGALGDLAALVRKRADDRGLARGLALAAAAALTAVVVGKAGFGLPAVHTLVALCLSAVFASVCARSAGLTDISPVGSVGQLTQAAYGGLLPGQPALNVAAGSVVAGTAAQTPVVLWSMRAGHALGASPRKMGVSALIGVLLGGILCVPAYLLLVGANGVASARLPMPSAQQWKAVAELVSGGAAALPPGALGAFLAAACFGAGVEALARTRATRFLPTPFAMGIGLLVPLHLAAALAAGSLLVPLANRIRPGAGERWGSVVGAGAIAGESFVGLAVSLLFSFAVLR